MAGMIWVDVEQCVGCGLCVEACPGGLIELVEGKAVIKEQGRDGRANSCDGCLKCFEDCANGALSVIVEPEPAALVSIESRGVPATAAPPGEKPAELGRWATGALVFLAEEFVPRLARAFLRVLERREAASSLPRRGGSAKRAGLTAWTESLPVDSPSSSVGGMRRRRSRRRGGVKSAAPSASKMRKRRTGG